MYADDLRSRSFGNCRAFLERSALALIPHILAKAIGYALPWGSREHGYAFEYYPGWDTEPENASCLAHDVNVVSDPESSLNSQPSLTAEPEIPEGAFVLTYGKLDLEITIRSAQTDAASAIT